MCYNFDGSGRPTEYEEADVFVCESQYKEAERQIRKLKSIKRYSVSNKVVDDEIYFFKKCITPLKEASPLLQQASEGTDMSRTDGVQTATLDEDDDKTVILTADEETQDSTSTATPIGTSKVQLAFGLFFVGIFQKSFIYN